MELARWIARTRARRFNASETHRTIRGVLHASKAMQQACEVLQQAAWIRPAMRRTQSSIGRVPTNYELNPKLPAMLAKEP
jgi:hypothetical protein